MCFNELFLFKPERRIIRKRRPLNLAFAVIPRRYPIVENGALKGFQFKQHLEIFPHHNWRNSFKFIERIKNCLKKRFQNDHDLIRCFNPNYVLTHVPLDKRR